MQWFSAGGKSCCLGVGHLEMCGAIFGHFGCHINLLWWWSPGMLNVQHSAKTVLDNTERSVGARSQKVLRNTDKGIAVIHNDAIKLKDSKLKWLQGSVREWRISGHRNPSLEKAPHQTKSPWRRIMWPVGLQFGALLMEVFLIWKHVYDIVSEEKKLLISMMPCLEKIV